MPINARALYVVSIIGSGVGFLTQTLVSGFWSTAFSHDVFHFSINLASYFLALGIGSLLSGKLKRPGAASLAAVTSALCLWSGLSISLLRLGIERWNGATWIPIGVVAVAGILNGLIVPLTLRVGENVKGLNLARLFFFDYFAAIAFTLVFTFLLLVPLGYGMTSLIVGATGAVPVIVWIASGRSKSVLAWSLAIAAVVIPYPLSLVSRGASRFTEADGTKVLFNRQSHYQKIVLTESTAGGYTLYPGLPQHSLYLDGFPQFSSADEQLYHLCITNIPMAAAEFNGRSVSKALILGGGDGLAARNLIASPRVKKVTLVELDPMVIDLARNHPKVRMYNLDSLRNPRVEIVTADAFRWVKTASETYDVIVIDFPSPKNLTLARLFSAEFYSSVFRILSPGGFIAIQAGPAYAPNDFESVSAVTASIKKTIQSIGRGAHLYMTQRDQDAFVLATDRTDFDMKAFSKKVGILKGGALSSVCTHDPSWREPAVEANTLNTLKLAGYALDWYKRVGQPQYFYYGGRYGVFLPD